jgi:hypothetical protein
MECKDCCLESVFVTIILILYRIMAGLLVLNELQEIQFSYTYFYFLSTYRGRGFIMIL